jgi:hypothetical protein
MRRCYRQVRQGGVGRFYEADRIGKGGMKIKRYGLKPMKTGKRYVVRIRNEDYGASERMEYLISSSKPFPLRRDRGGV